MLSLLSHLVSQDENEVQLEQEVSEPALSDLPASDVPWFDQILWTLGGEGITVMDVAIAGLIILTAFQISRFIQELAERGMRRANFKTDTAIAGVRRAIHYTVILIGFLTAVGNIGIDIQTLVTASAIFAVAFGFAMQNIAQNFVSGVILLVERSIKPGDVLELEGRVVRVVEMGIRATVVRGLDDEEMIVPNAMLVQNTVKNYTLRDQLHRLRALVGVTYSSDMKLVHETLEETARAIEWRVQGRAPRIHPPPIRRLVGCLGGIRCGSRTRGTPRVSSRSSTRRSGSISRRRTSRSPSRSSTCTSTRGLRTRSRSSCRRRNSYAFLRAGGAFALRHRKPVGLPRLKSAAQIGELGEPSAFQQASGDHRAIA